MSSEFLITLTYHVDSIRMGCAGELDISTARKLRDAIDLCLEQRPSDLTIDGQGISLLTSSGIEVLLHAVERCREQAIALDLRLSRASRKVLDIVGLWWLGVVDEGPETDKRHALRTYAALRHTPQFERVLERERRANR